MDPTILRRADPAALHPAALQPAVISRLKIKDPDVWSGKLSTLPGFLTSCRVKFMLEKHNFTDEISKIGYAGSFLNGTPADWWHGLFHRYKASGCPVELTSFAEFSRALTASFGDPDMTSTMERKLRTLRQTASVADYATEFQRIAGYLTTAGWSDRPLLSNYRANLKDNIKRSLVHEKPFPTTLREMIAASIRIDNCEYEIILDRKADLDRKAALDGKVAAPTPLTTSTNGCAQE
jgi:Retrotransposon gag protein